MVSPQVKFTRAMVGYGLWVALEDTLRNWLSKRLAEAYGEKWPEQIPTGIWNKIHERYNEAVKASNLEQIRELIEHSDFPDIFDIVRFRKQVNIFLPDVSVDDIDYYNQKLYSLRNQIAHKPYSFTVRSLDELIGSTEWVIEILGPLGHELNTILRGIQEAPELYAREIPDDFILSIQPSNQYSTFR